MSEIGAASRKATSVLRGHTEEDIVWAEVRVSALMIEGKSLVHAVSQTAEECRVRIMMRKVELDQQGRLDNFQREIDSVLKDEAEAKQRRINGLIGQPTLRSSLGDMLAARRRV